MLPRHLRTASAICSVVLIAWFALNASHHVWNSDIINLPSTAGIPPAMRPRTKKGSLLICLLSGSSDASQGGLERQFGGRGLGPWICSQRAAAGEALAKAVEWFVFQRPIDQGGPIR